MSLQVSVVIPTHNPRLDYLRRTLEALAAQTLDRSSWELVVVDNKSEESLERELNPALERMGWATAAQSGVGNARVVREEKLGLTNARLRGFAETTGKVVVLVDDDNVLSRDYLFQAMTIAKEWPQIWAFGGSSIPKFECPPPEHLRKYLNVLALRNIERTSWSNSPPCDLAEPWGAGLCLRREAALAYQDYVEREGNSMTDRVGSELISGGDTEICRLIYRLGHGTGTFPQLSLEHLIPASRVEEKYLLRLHQGIQISHHLILSKWDNVKHASAYHPLNIIRLIIRLGKGSLFEKKLALARFRGVCLAQELLRKTKVAKTDQEQNWSQLKFSR